MQTETRELLSLRRWQAHATRAVIDGNASTLRQERLRRGLTIQAAAAKALVSERSWKRAEASP